MPYNNSIDKIVGTYFASVTKEVFTYKNKTYKPKKLNVAPHFFHEYSCVLGCSGCCSSTFSLDFIACEERPPESVLQTIEKTFKINDTIVKYYSAPNKKGESSHCDMVNTETGSCCIHKISPLSCDFETLRFVQYDDHTWLGTRPFGRGWNMLRIDGDRGAICKFPKIKTEEATKEAIRKLTRLKMYTDAANLETWIPDIVEWAKKGPTSFPLVLLP